MNQHRFISLLFCTAMMFFLISCGGGGREEKSTTDTTTAKTDTSTATSTTPQPAASTISTTPQDMMVAMHKVKDFDKWKASFDAHDSMKNASGVHSYVVGRGLQDPNMVLVALKVDDMKKAKAFSTSPSLKKAMQEGGVVGTPTIKFMTMVFQDTGNISTDLRMRSSFSVKDWDKWQKSFDSTRALNEDNGLKVRAYGHETADNHKVTIVAAVTDSTKARAFFSSDELKKRRMASGVMGEPNRFFYRVVQRY